MACKNFIDGKCMESMSLPIANDFCTKLKTACGDYKDRRRESSIYC